MGGLSINHNRCQVFTPVWEQKINFSNHLISISKLSNFLKGKRLTRGGKIRKANS